MWEIKNHVHRVGDKMIYIIWALLLLVICTYTDIKDRYVYSGICIGNSVVAVCIHFLLKDMSLKNLELAIIIGVITILLSYAFKEKIGRGDALIILSIGLIEGGFFLMSVIVWALIILNAFAIAGITIKKLKIKSSLPLVPFVLLGNVVVAIFNGGQI